MLDVTFVDIDPAQKRIAAEFYRLARARLAEGGSLYANQLTRELRADLLAAALAFASVAYIAAVTA